MRKISIAAIAIIFSLWGINFSWGYEKELRSISLSLAENILRSGKKTIAVVDFTDLQGNVTELGRFLAEELSATLSEAGKGFEVVDRTHLKSLLKEHQLAMTGLIDPSTARKLGEIAGVHALITGTITPFGDSIRLAVKVLDTATAKVIGASRGDIPKTKAIEELLTRSIDSPPVISSQPSAPSYSTPSGIQSKRIGNVSIAIKKVTATLNEAAVVLDFFNHSDKNLVLGASLSDGRPKLLDDKGGRYSYQSGVYRALSDQQFQKYGTDKPKKHGTILAPKSNNDIIINFHNVDRKVGAIFSFSMEFILAETEGSKYEKHQVSFIDIKAAVPKE
jgi:TolB-like protein